jgi:hypothetical protein
MCHTPKKRRQGLPCSLTLGDSSGNWGEVHRREGVIHPPFDSRAPGACLSCLRGGGARVAGLEGEGCVGGENGGSRPPERRVVRQRDESAAIPRLSVRILSGFSDGDVGVGRREPSRCMI